MMHPRMHVLLSATCSSLLLAATLLQAGAAQSVGVVDHLVWPPPKSISTSGQPLRLDPTFAVATDSKSARLAVAIARHAATVAPALASASKGGGAATLSELRLFVLPGASEKLTEHTSYAYTLSVSAGTGTANATCQTIYGCVYALETFTQLLDFSAGALLHSDVSVADSPDYAWRGLMIDSGRRFVPMKTLLNLMDTMAANKMNVLHLHASDHCRWGVESKLYPNLTDALTGIKAGFYSQKDIKQLIAEGGTRGIRVVPEFDIPGHSRGFMPLSYREDGIKFCTDDATRSQLYDDPEGVTYKTLHALMGEMAALFTDDVFNIGSDETAAKGKCTVNSTFAIERRLLAAIENDFKKTPEGWEEVFFDAGAATMKTIVDAWARHSPSEITKTGRRAIESAASHFYFTAAGPAGPPGWSKCWYDIATGVPADQKKLLLGGEMSMWTDTYCYIRQCGSSTGAAPIGHELFNPANDAAFHESIGGMIWPRGYVGAAAFWNFDATTDPAAPGFVSSIWKLNDGLAKRGSSVCPSKCACDQLSACGKPYLK